MSKAAVCSLLLMTLVACSRQPDAERACTPPRVYWQKPHCMECGLEAVRMTIQIDHNSKVSEGGEPVSIGKLSRDLALASQIGPPEVQVFLETEMGANCSTVEQVRDLIDQHLKCRVSGHCAEGNKTVWNKLPLPPGTPPS